MRLRYADFARAPLRRPSRGHAGGGAGKCRGHRQRRGRLGNTYQAGVVSTDNGTYNWRVSVIELDEVYDISGLPNTAFYVGIRFTAQA
ncbi:MAG: hypothetical protein ACLUW6_01590 [Coriobacteriaceae bacterium]